jgi:hypothetical protein
MPTEKIKQRIEHLELDLAKHNAVKDKFPDTTVNWMGEFSSKTVNQNYTDFEFETWNKMLYVSPYFNLEFTHNNKSETVKIFSTPRRNKLVYVDHTFEAGNYRRIIRFSKMMANFKQRNFSEKMFNTCRTEIMNFIKEHPGISLDKKYMEPRLQKLLLFV